MTSVSAGHIILTPTEPVGSAGAGGHSGDRTRDLLRLKQRWEVNALLKDLHFFWVVQGGKKNMYMYFSL